MEFIPTSVHGLWQIALSRVRDERGSFVRTFDAAAFAAHGVETAWPEHGEAHNARAGTIRGLHRQHEPYAEAKLIRCTRGAVYDVLVDVRPDSPTYGSWEAFELSEERDVMLYAPAGLVHGYQTLHDGTTVAYLHSTPYASTAATGFRYDSAALAIPWPLPVTAISARDLALVPFAP
jgi:dTDP-4-dehydrorhamnose 3,5-epimerase